MSINNLVVLETKNPDVIKSVLCHPDIYPCIIDDSCPSAEEFEPPMDGEKYIAGQVDDEVIGIVVLHTTEEGQKCHIQVLPEYRKAYAREFASKAYKFSDGDLYCEIAECFPNVLRFAESFGFKPTQRIKGDFILNGKNYDLIKMRLNNGYD